MSTMKLQHGRLELALHCLRPKGPGGGTAAGPAVLLLHELGASAPKTLESVTPPGLVQVSSGALWALDFTGHGESQWPGGGGYSPEVLMADVDHALAQIGPAAVVGAGLGGFVAVLIAGARPETVRGAVVLPGEGLHGGGVEPQALGRTHPEAGQRLTGVAASDPLALHELSRDIRPPGYVGVFARQAEHLSGLKHPISVTPEAVADAPMWLEELSKRERVCIAPLESALASYCGL